MTSRISLEGADIAPMFATVDQAAADLNLTVASAPAAGEPETDPLRLRLSMLIGDASQVVEDFIGRRIMTITATERWDLSPSDFSQDGTSRVTLLLTLRPVVGILSMKVYGSDIPIDAPDGLDLDDEAGILIVYPFSNDGYCWPDWITGRLISNLTPVAIRYRAGYSLNPGQGRPPPATVRRATLDAVSALWHRTGQNSRDPMLIERLTTDVGRDQWGPGGPGSILSAGSQEILASMRGVCL